MACGISISYQAFFLDNHSLSPTSGQSESDKSNHLENNSVRHCLRLFCNGDGIYLALERNI